MGFTMLGIAVPNFVVAPLLTLVFGLTLRWLPVGGWGAGAFSPAHMVLPILALALPQIAAIARLTRGSMIEVLGSNYVRTARAKGLPERITLTRHAIKATLPPLVSYLGPPPPASSPARSSSSRSSASPASAAISCRPRSIATTRW
jgi:oligopeptide transport system permease protein